MCDVDLPEVVGPHVAHPIEPALVECARSWAAEAARMRVAVGERAIGHRVIPSLCQVASRDDADERAEPGGGVLGIPHHAFVVEPDGAHVVPRLGRVLVPQPQYFGTRGSGGRVVRGVPDVARR